MGSLLDPFHGTDGESTPSLASTIEDGADSDDSDAELHVDDKEFLRKLQRDRERAKDTRPLVRLVLLSHMRHSCSFQCLSSPPLQSGHY